MSAAMAAAMRAAGVDTEVAEAEAAATAHVAEALPAPPPLPAGWQSHWDPLQKR